MRRATKQAAAGAADRTTRSDDTPPAVAPLQPAIVRMAALTQYVGDVTPRTIWRWVADGKFPPPVELPSGMPAWRMDDIQAWLAALQVRSRA